MNSLDRYAPLMAILLGAAVIGLGFYIFFSIAGHPGGISGGGS